MNKIETDSNALDFRALVNIKYSQNDYDGWLISQLDLKRGQNVLDLGCGTGKNLFEISDIVGNEGKVVGLDICDESLEKCNKKIKNLIRQNISLVKSDFTSIGENISDKFDRIYSSFAIYYTQNLEKTLNDCSDLLNPNSKLLFCGPSKNSNKEFLELVEESGGSRTNSKWSCYLEDKAYPQMRELFGNVEISYFSNPIIFPDRDTLFKYWVSTPHYNPKNEKEMKKVIDSKFRDNGKFINNKEVVCLQYESQR